MPSAHRRRYADRGYLLFPVSSGELAVGIVVGAFEDEAIEPDVHRWMTLQLTHARRTLRTNPLGQLREGSSFLQCACGDDTQTQKPPAAMMLSTPKPASAQKVSFSMRANT